MSYIIDSSDLMEQMQNPGMLSLPLLGATMGYVKIKQNAQKRRARKAAAAKESLMLEDDSDLMEQDVMKVPVDLAKALYRSHKWRTAKTDEERDAAAKMFGMLNDEEDILALY